MIQLGYITPKHDKNMWLSSIDENVGHVFNHQIICIQNTATLMEYWIMHGLPWIAIFFWSSATIEHDDVIKW